MSPPSAATSRPPEPPPDLEWFEALSSVWHRDTDRLSSLARKFDHPSYRAVLARGKEAVPFILREIERQPGHWHYALRTLTGADPVPPGATATEACQRWVAWGRPSSGRGGGP